MYNPYKILGVSSRSTKAEIKVRYRELCKVYHPDNPTTGDIALFQQISKAWKHIEQYHKDTQNKPMWKHKTLFSIYKED